MRGMKDQIAHIVPWQRAARQTDSMRAAAEAAAEYEEVRGEQGLLTGLLETEDGGVEALA
jgi:hypothetical protein